VLLTLFVIAAIAAQPGAAQDDSFAPIDPNAPQNSDQQPNKPPAQTPEGVPSQTPSVVLDDTQTTPQTQTKGAKQEEQNQGLTEQGSKTETSQTGATKTETTRTSTTRSRTETTQIRSAKPQTMELTDFQRLVALSLGHTLPIYGQSLFQNVPTTFAPVDRVPVTADYVIGPGDELLIRAWGQIDLDIHTRVDRNGAIYIPKVGNLNVAGLRYDQLQDFLKSRIGRIYQNFDLNVTMGQLRSIDIFVVGQARRPGRYTVSSLSTLANAVFACGGPSPAGSMRHIELKRGATVVTDFDLYDLLLKGDKSKDVQLQPQDVIYFPPIGPQVAMGGQVNNPAIYELKNETTLADALRLTGGLATTAYGGKVYVEQIKDRQERSIEEIKLDEAGLARRLKDGDVLNFTPISPRFVNSVTLRGNVAQPGRYPWHEGMRISDLIPNREFLITRQYWNQQNAVTLQMQQSGARLNKEINDVKRNAPEINWDYAVIQRISSKDLSTELIPFNLGKAVLQHEESSNVPLEPGDIVTIFSQADLRVPREQQTKLVRLEGEFTAAGIYRAQPGQALRDLVAEAGGLAPSAYLYGAVFTRESTRVQQQERLNMLIAQMERDLARQTAAATQNAKTSDEANAAHASLEARRASIEKLRQLKANGRIVLNFHPNDASLQDIPDIPLEDGDQFYVPSRPIVVSVVGDVYNQGSFLQQSGKTVSRYLREAGGPTRNADKGRTFVVRANGAVVSKDTASVFWSGGFSSMILMPGDTVVVPEQLNPGAGLQNFKDWSQILFNFGLAAAAINLLK
jgi:protein involved in polysaccharide export with SLBB domain